MIKVVKLLREPVIIYCVYLLYIAFHYGVFITIGSGMLK